jgi:hypothetical protein
MAGWQGKKALKDFLEQLYSSSDRVQCGNIAGSSRCSHTSRKFEEIDNCCFFGIIMKSEILSPFIP